jgi:hypothetical protein
MRTINSIEKIVNDRHRLDENFTERIFPMIAPRDEKRRRSEEAEFDLSKISFE